MKGLAAVASVAIFIGSMVGVKAALIEINLSQELRSQPVVKAVRYTESESQEPVLHNQQVLDFHQKELECLITNMYFEARGEPREGQKGVAFVTLNRVMADRFRDRVCDVVHQARLDENGDPVPYGCQFSWYCDGTDYTTVHKHTFNRLRRDAEYIYINHYINPGETEDITQGSTHFHATRVQPFWSEHPNYQLVANFGNHLYYRPTY